MVHLLLRVGPVYTISVRREGRRDGTPGWDVLIPRSATLSPTTAGLFSQRISDKKLKCFKFEKRVVIWPKNCQVEIIEVANVILVWVQNAFTRTQKGSVFIWRYLVRTRSTLPPRWDEIGIHINTRQSLYYERWSRRLPRLLQRPISTQENKHGIGTQQN